jgi:outer membrane protein assembly factor BamA
VGDFARYWRVGSGAVFGARLQVGGALGALDRTLPAQERLYAGGPTTVRGFRQNELGPVVYIVDRVVFDTVGAPPGTAFVQPDTLDQGYHVAPTGGNSVVVGNLEMRLRSPLFPDLLQWTLFTDVGEVWNRRANQPNLGFERLRVTPGFGLRAFSPIGAIRVDFGYNGYRPQQGAAYYNVPTQSDDTAPLLCVSPVGAARIPVTITPDGNGGFILSQSYSLCGGDFQPPRETNFLQRFSFFFAIGQAF